MSYAVMQIGADAPGMEKLKRAYRETRGLAEQDAMPYGPAAYGTLGRGLELEQATGLKNALAAQGTEADVVEESELPKLPPAQIVNRIDCTEEALVIYDALGRGSPVNWEQVMITAAGNVCLSEFKRVPSGGPVLQNPSGALWLEPLAGGGPEGGKYSQDQPASRYMTEEHRHNRFLLEVVLTGGTKRYSINADQSVAMLFAYLGERRTRNLQANFIMLVQDLIRFAPHGTLNRGAYYLQQDPNAIGFYPTKTSFYNEIIWLLWMLRR